jgi:DNA-binding FrmR family transcriptional regulator
MADLRPTIGDGPPAQHALVGTVEQQALVTRLNRIEGQIRGIRRMVTEQRQCIEILQQLAAAEAALNRISLAVFKHHIDTCVTESIARGEPDRHQQLTELVDIFDRFAK